MKRLTFFGELSCEIEKNPTVKQLTYDTELNDNQMKFYFLLDRYFYELKENEEITNVFDSGFYEICTLLDFSEDKYQFYQKYSMRVMSIHTLILGRTLPFIAVGVGNNFTVSVRQMALDKVDEFDLYDVQKKWEYLKNDYPLLEKNIDFNSSFQKSLIWYTMANKSTLHIEKFMCMYRAIEEFSREFHRNTVSKLNDFIKNELYMFDSGKMKKTMRIPLADQVLCYLNSLAVDQSVSSKIISFRDKIAHGVDYSIEYNNNLHDTIYEMDDIIATIISLKIKEMNIKGLKNSDFWRNYDLLINENERKIALVYCYTDPLCKLDEWNIMIGLEHGIFEKDQILKCILKELKELSLEIPLSIIEDIINNPGIILEF